MTALQKLQWYFTVGSSLQRKDA